MTNLNKLASRSQHSLHNRNSRQNRGSRLKQRFMTLLLLAALLAAGIIFFLPRSNADTGTLLGLDVIDEDLEYERPGDGELTVLLSKSVYPFEDRHMDVIIWLGEDPQPGDKPEGELEIAVKDTRGRLLEREVVKPIPGARLFAAPAIPAELEGDYGSLQVVWRRGEQRETVKSRFKVRPAADVQRSGRVEVEIPNDEGVYWRNAPVTVGVPFPRGALDTQENVRLTDAEGREIPMQTKVTSHWTRFGSIRWLQCDFTVELSGEEKKVFVEYGPEVQAADSSDNWLETEDAKGFPTVEAENFRIDADGLFFTPQDSDSEERLLTPEALHGAFVNRADGRNYRLPADAEFEIEELGASKAVVTRKGWYKSEDGEDEFCKFVTRFIIHRQSRLIRLLHTWIYTGDPYREEDQIREMGWKLPTDGGFERLGFLAGSGEDRQWLKGDLIVQRDIDRFRLGREGKTREYNKSAAGVFGINSDRTRLLVGNLDFARNYPRELAFTADGLCFYEWPAHAGKRLHTEHHKAPHRLWFAHEGETMDLALPREYAYDSRILDELASSRRNVQGYTYQGIRQEQANAQGIAKTAELWLLPSQREVPLENEERIMRGLQEGTFQAVVAPDWMAASDAMIGTKKFHPRDTENFPEAERVYQLHAEAPLHWAERAHVYGKWLWATTPHSPDLRDRYQTQHRAFRKSHQGWPYSWLPFVRSGDARFFRYADAQTRFQTDIAFCHYSDEKVQDQIKDGPRPRGWYTRDRIPWAHNRKTPTTRAREDKAHYLWHAYYLTGYHRARDVALDFAELTKHEGAGVDRARPARQHTFDWDGGTLRFLLTLLRSYTEMYEATFDPWFLASAHHLADQYMKIPDHMVNKEAASGAYYNTGIEQFYRLTGDPELGELFLRQTKAVTRQREYPLLTYWGESAGMLEALALCWDMSREPFFLGRITGMMDMARAATFDGEPEYYQGTLVRARGTSHPPTFTGWYLQQFPVALSALARAGEDNVPEAIPPAYWQAPAQAEETNEDGVYLYRMPEIAVYKQAGEELPLNLMVKAPKGKKENEFYDWVVEYPDGKKRKGQWKIHKKGEKVRSELEHVVTLAATDPEGVYRVLIEGKSATAFDSDVVPRLYLPLTPTGFENDTKPPFKSGGAPEVMIPRADNAVGPARVFSPYWFRVPEDVDEFNVRFTIPRYPSKDHPLVRFTIWNPDNEEAWVEQFDRRDYSRDTVKAKVEVPSEYRGKLWRITIPHERFNRRGKPAFILDDRIEPVFSVTKGRWFDPE